MYAYTYTQARAAKRIRRAWSKLRMGGMHITDIARQFYYVDFIL